MELAEQLGILPGITAVVGSGGKTTLLCALGEGLSAGGAAVILCTTTKIYPFAGIFGTDTADEAVLTRLLRAHRLVCAGLPAGDSGKLTAPGIPMARLARLADYVLVEADGAHGRPLKAHAPWEPAVPPEAERVVCAAGVLGIGRPIAECAHRPERYAALAGAAEDETVTPEMAARVLRAERLGEIYLLNQADGPEELAAARRVAALLDAPAVCGSLRKGETVRC
ncbi:MAG: putative selenium-dependent hydroxylase accessory protein YqeC [Oscillibacter sp.]|jgi:probable selenium-dependent hydroxylase accessory protein YqeC|nr:putative selenium-dependent hydroxylase accessory protein YqeC [Oscillibacter sp.]